MSQPIAFDPKTTSAAAPRQTTLSPRDEQRLRSAAADFESLFIQQMLTSMRKTVPKDENGEGLIRESQGEKIFRDMLDGEYANIMSHRGGRGMGLGEMMFQQLVKRYQLQANQPMAGGQPAALTAERELKQLQSGTNAMQASQFGPKTASK
ncbi:MAG: rod-binding protein [Magnetococcales bacterium]|nr:rod-binding protein [Magnetococcales bacterium]MBF0346122.1 rod-binding protein [Magnetococcales bacterium]MBF0632354.1 rod-binding protein [Magnetococcales bacterium]